MEIEETAYGKARLSPAAFYDLTPWEYWRSQAGYESAMIDQWKIARWVASIVIAPHIKKPIAPEKLLPMAGDAEYKPVTIKNDDFISLLAKAYS